MATVPPHTHTFTIPNATEEQIRQGIDSGVAVEPPELRTVLNEEASLKLTKSENLADLGSATTARLNLGFPADTNRYLRNNGSGVPAAVGSTESANLDAYAAGDIMLDSTADGAALVTALATGKTVVIPRSIAGFSLSVSQAQTILPQLHKLSFDADLTITLASGVHTFSTGGNVEMVKIGPNGARLTITGADPVPLTMTSVASVTGSTTNYSVTYNVTAPGAVAVNSVVAVGDILKIFECGPIPILNGDNVASYILRNRPLSNEIMGPRTNLGLITIAASATSASFSGGIDTTANCLAVNDLLTSIGQTRQIATVGPGNACTFSAAWGAIGVSGETAYFVTKPNTGTITISGTAVTGSSTLFLSEANVGDMLLVDGELIEIAGITNDTSMTLQKAKTLGVGTNFSIITGGVLHDGAYEVTGVTSSTVTVRNRNRVAPPVNKVVGGSFRVIKTVLKQTATSDGIKADQGCSLKYIDKVALIGPRQNLGMALGGRVPAMPLAIDGTSSFGSYTQNGYRSHFLCGPDFAVVDFDVNCYVGYGCSIDARMAAFSGASQICVWQAEGTFANLRRAVMSGSAGQGHAMNAGARAVITEARHVGNVSDGLRRDIGATAYGEAPMSWANGGMNYRISGAGGLHLSDGISALAAASTLYCDRSGARADRMILAAPRQGNIDCQDALHVSAPNSWITGSANANGVNGAGAVRVRVTSSGISGNKNIGVYANQISTNLDVTGCYIVGTGSGTDIRADNGGQINATSAYAAGTVQVSGNASLIIITSALGSPTLSGVARANEPSVNGSIIRNGTATVFNLPATKINGAIEVTAGVQFPAAVALSADPNRLDDYEEGTWTPTVTSSTGTLTTVSANSGSYTKVGNRVMFNATATLTDIGTGGQSLLFTLPFTPSISVPANALNVSTALAGYGLVNTDGTMSVRKYDGTFPAANGNVIRIAGNYPTAA
jgi:hypothetical protein